MDPNTFPTKGNLILAKNSLSLATMGYGLMDKKRNILIRSLWALLTRQRAYRQRLTQRFRAAYELCRRPILNWASTYVQEIGLSVPVDDGVKIQGQEYHGDRDSTGTA